MYSVSVRQSRSKYLPNILNGFTLGVGYQNDKSLKKKSNYLYLEEYMS